MENIILRLKPYREIALHMTHKLSDKLEFMTITGERVNYFPARTLSSLKKNIRFTIKRPVYIFDIVDTFHIVVTSRPKSEPASTAPLMAGAISRTNWSWSSTFPSMFMVIWA